MSNADTFAELNSENSIVIQQWDEPTGTWLDIDEAPTPSHARAMIHQRQSVWISDSLAYFRIVYTQATVIPPAS